MYYDIVGSLPLELLVRVVEYLDLEDVVRIHGVRNDHSLWGSKAEQ